MNLETTVAVPAQSALFSDASPVDAINNALGMLAVVRETFASEDQHYPIWITIGAIQDSIKSAVTRL
jgi:hypothetical protein